MTTPAHRLPLAIPRLDGESFDRASDATSKVIRGMQSRKRRAQVLAGLGAGTDPVVECTVLDAYQKVRVVGAWWDSSGDLAASGTDYWTFILRERRDSGQTRMLGRISTSAEGIEAFKRRTFEPLAGRIIEKGRRVTLEVTETGTAASRPRGSLLLLIEEVD